MYGKKAELYIIDETPPEETKAEEAKAQEDLEYLLACALIYDFGHFITYKYRRVIHLWRYGKTERVRKKNDHRLNREIRKELRRLAAIQ